MYCRHCGEKIPTSSKFCKKCGKALIKYDHTDPPKVLDKYKIEKPFEDDGRTRFSVRADFNISNFFDKLFSTPIVNYFKKERIKKTKFITILVVLCLVGFLVYGFDSFFNNESFITNIGSKNSLPGLENPKDIKYEWTYNKKDYSITMTLYQSVDDYYSSIGQPQSLDDEEFYSGFLEIPEEDKSITELVVKINDIAEENRMDKDETLELAASFVQSIPYDEDKINRGDYYPRYPYEVLYDKKGICTGKSFLMNLILDELGYGNSLFIYEDAEHMTSAVKCNKEYSTKGTGYCVIETTNYLTVGIEADIDINTNRAITLDFFTEYNKKANKDNERLSTPIVIAEKDGQEYSGIVGVYSMQKKINNYLDYFEEAQTDISVIESKLEGLKSNLDYYDSIYDYYSYNNTAEEYNITFSKYDTKINQYNRKIGEYNNLIEKWDGY